MTKAIYVCYYDGKKCEKAVPKFDENGVLIKESHENIMKKYGKIMNNEQISYSWDKCDSCKAGCTISGLCHGRLEIVCE